MEHQIVKKRREEMIIYYLDTQTKLNTKKKLKTVKDDSFTCASHVTFIFSLKDDDE